MLIHFQTKNVTFFDEDKDYYEKRITSLEKILGWEKGDPDSVEAHIHIEKTKASSGDRFIASVNITSPHHGKFYADVAADTIKKGADLLKEKLRQQIVRFHESKK